VAKALAAYHDPRGSRSFTVSLLRKGQPMDMNVTVR
jgi:hypothetical protein